MFLREDTASVSAPKTFNTCIQLLKSRGDYAIEPFCMIVKLKNRYMLCSVYNKEGVLVQFASFFSHPGSGTWWLNEFCLYSAAKKVAEMNVGVCVFGFDALNFDSNIICNNV